MLTQLALVKKATTKYRKLPLSAGTFSKALKDVNLAQKQNVLRTNVLNKHANANQKEKNATDVQQKRLNALAQAQLHRLRLQLRHLATNAQEHSSGFRQRALADGTVACRSEPV